MHTHSPSCLPGPITRDRDRWSLPAEADALRNPDPIRPTVLFRRFLVERVRRQIAEGTYDTPEKFEVALERMLRSLDLE